MVAWWRDLPVRKPNPNLKTQRIFVQYARRTHCMKKTARKIISSLAADHRARQTSRLQTDCSMGILDGATQNCPGPDTLSSIACPVDMRMPLSLWRTHAYAFLQARASSGSVQANKEAKSCHNSKPPTCKPSSSSSVEKLGRAADCLVTHGRSNWHQGHRPYRNTKVSDICHIRLWHPSLRR